MSSPTMVVKRMGRRYVVSPSFHADRVAFGQWASNAAGAVRYGIEQTPGVQVRQPVAWGVEVQWVMANGQPCGLREAHHGEALVWMEALGEPDE